LIPYLTYYVKFEDLTSTRDCILLRNECAKEFIPPMPLYICVADSQGGIGAMMSESLNNHLRKEGIKKAVSTIITHVVVDSDDPAFREPSKPIGPYYSEEDAKKYIELRGWRMREIPDRGWRRLVPSPEPKRIIEIDSIKAMVDNGIIPIAGGGGGIPVIEQDGGIRGVDAVIDKDLTASLLAIDLGVKRFIILTDVDGVYLNYGRSSQKRLDRINILEAKRYFSEGHFPLGDMGPKIESAIKFIESGGREAIISLPEDLIMAMEGKKGTRVTL
jgi:carbamate kinase